MVPSNLMRNYTVKQLIESFNSDYEHEENYTSTQIMAHIQPVKIQINNGIQGTFTTDGYNIWSFDDLNLKDTIIIGGKEYRIISKQDWIEYKKYQGELVHD